MLDQPLETLDEAMALARQIEQEAPSWKIAQCVRYGRWDEIMIYTESRVLYVDSPEDWTAIRERYLA